MTPHRLTLLPLADPFAICRLDPIAAVPGWAVSGAVWSVTRTGEELSVVCPESVVPPGVTCDTGWRGWRIAGTFDLGTMTGVLAAVVDPLAEAGVSVFAVSTFDTDYLWVKAANAGRAVAVWRQHGHQV
jgi:hypothetical protein